MKKVILILIFMPILSVYGQYISARSHAPRPSENLRGFHGRLGSSSLSTFLWEASRLNYARSPNPGQLTVNLSPNFSSSWNVRRSTVNFVSPALTPLTSSSSSSLAGGTSYTPGSVYVSAPFLSLGSSSYPTDFLILLPRDQSIKQKEIVSAQVSASRAFIPLMGKGLQQPNLSAKRPKDAPITPLSEAYSPPELSRSSLYVAQQISKARNYVKQAQYEQALVCYKAANAINPKNIQSLVGIIFSYIMQKKPQPAGLEVIRLAKLHPEIWDTTPDYLSFFGLDKFAIADRLSSAQPDIDYFININKGSQTDSAKESLKLSYLCKTFISWLTGDRKGMIANITTVANIAPFDPDVQRIYELITGRKPHRIKTTELKPIK